MEYINYKEYFNAIRQSTGYDFSGYMTDSLQKRLESFISSERIASPDELRDKLFYDKHAQELFLGKLLINYTEFFRDPDFFQALRLNVLPYLSTFNNINIWHTGCSTGEEAYSLTILLNELDLLNRCTIHATDINSINIEIAGQGIYPLRQIRESAKRYYKSGGKNSLSDYYTVYNNHIIFHSSLRKKINFYTHDLKRVNSFSGYHLILCRNVFIYMNDSLQTLFLKNVKDSLENYGYLVLGSKENIGASSSCLCPIDKQNKIYRKIC